MRRQPVVCSLRLPYERRTRHRFSVRDPGKETVLTVALILDVDEPVCCGCGNSSRSSLQLIVNLAAWSWRSPSRSRELQTRFRDLPVG